MSKLALIALLLGACVAEDSSTTSARTFGDEITATNVVDEIEIPTWGDDNVDVDLVLVTGLEIPGRVPSTDHIDLTNVDLLDLDPTTREICALADSLPSTDVCSFLCQPSGFAARLLGSGTGDCTEQRCDLPGGVSVQTQVCVSGN